MPTGDSLRNIILLVLAVIIVSLLWRALWTLAGIFVFLLLVYVVYQFLSGRR
jgi:hypothetical protein